MEGDEVRLGGECIGRVGARRGGGARLEIGEEGNVAHLGAGKEMMDATVRRGVVAETVSYA